MCRFIIQGNILWEGCRPVILLTVSQISGGIVSKKERMGQASKPSLFFCGYCIKYIMTASVKY